jgi:hypothetical protein
MKTLLLVIFFVLIASVAFTACSQGGNESDGGIDAGEDAGLDAGADLGTDAGADPGQDAGADLGTDAGADPGQDAGADPGTDAGVDAGEDAGWDAGSLPDHDPQSSFLLLIPPGTALCTVFCEGRTWQEEYQMQGRIDLIPGAYVLPRTEAPLDSDLIESVVFGPDHIPAQATGPGSFDVMYYYGAWQYIYRQDFLLQSEPYHLDVTIWFEPSYWGPNWPAQATLEGEFAASWTWALSRMGSGSGWCEEQQGFAFHDLSSMPGVEYQGTTAGGDHVLAEVLYAQACQVAGNTNCEEVDYAELSLGGVQRVLSDPDALIYSAGHHNFGQQYLLLLDTPIGETTAVLVEAPDMGQTQGGALIRLDESLTPLGSEPFTDWQAIWR